MKADVQNVSGELIVSGLDSATSLIQAAKNLMNAVVLTVKSCYVASTKYPRLAAEGKLNQLKPVVVWKMKVGEIVILILNSKKIMHKSFLLRNQGHQSQVQKIRLCLSQQVGKKIVDITNSCLLFLLIEFKNQVLF